MSVYEVADNSANVGRIHEALLARDARFDGVVRSREDGYLRIEWSSDGTTRADIEAVIAQVVSKDSAGVYARAARARQQKANLRRRLYSPLSVIVSLPAYNLVTVLEEKIA